MAVQQDYSPILTKSTIATILNKSVPNLTIGDLHTLLDALNRQPVGDTTKKMSDVFLNTTGPTVTTCTLAAGPHFVTSDVMTFTVTFSDFVYVTGTPEIHVVIGSNTRQATYSAGTGSTALTFTYTVVSGDAATAGNVTVATNALALNSGTVIDENRNNATLTLPSMASAMASVFVN